MEQFEIMEFVPETNEVDMKKLLSAFLTIWNDPQNLKYLSFTLNHLRRRRYCLGFCHHEWNTQNERME
ncbi:MAG: hypothetical protein SVZ03_02755 [Spirochaetota bacterium]|nr:hypothetical protein [Spirochaetota bacterium]